MKESYPVQVAEFAVANKLVHEPAFCWWVPYTLRKRDVILASVKARVRNTTVKYGIVRPSSVKEARAIDKANGNTLWQDAIDLEINTILPAFDFPSNNHAPKDYSRSSGHIVFDVKMDFTRKA